MRTTRILLLSLLSLGPGCKDDQEGTSAASLPTSTSGPVTGGTSAPTTGASMSTTSTTGTECPGPGFLGCSCTDDGKCLEGLKCLPSINTCIDPSDLTGGEATTTTATSTTGDDCPEGFENCPCLPGDVCIIGLECIQGTCWFLPDTTTGDGVCVDDYEPCFSQAECCDVDQHCLDFSQTNGDGVICAPECQTHTECPSKCCGGVQELALHVCYSAPCETLCANTCEYAYDGQCDDGGPGSEFAVCEYGTDCADCGGRASSDAPW